jgi:hypothetical protein
VTLHGTAVDEGLASGSRATGCGVTATISIPADLVTAAPPRPSEAPVPARNGHAPTHSEPTRSTA